MSPFAIQLERSELRVGETLRGELRVREALPKSRTLDIHLECRGKHVTSTKIASQRLHSGPLEVGMRFPFELAIPKTAPFHFEGHALSLGYRVRAAADVPWALDPAKETEVLVRPGELPISERESLRIPPESKSELGIVMKALVGIFIAVLALTLLPLIPLFLYLIAKARVREGRLDQAKLELPDRAFALGDWVPLTLRFRVKRPVRVEALRVKLEGIEVWTTGSGKNARTRTHTFHQEERLLLEDTVIAGAPRALAPDGGAYRSGPRRSQEGPIFEHRTAFRLPEEGLASLDRKVVYKVIAHLELKDLDNLTVFQKVQVAGLRLAGEAPRPEERSFRDQSGDLAFVGPGEEGPAGLDLKTEVAPLWHWPVLMAAGVFVGGFGVALLANLGGPAGPLVLGAGALCLVGGLGGLLRTIFG